MSRSTCNVFNPQITGTRTNWYTIITGSNFGVDDGDVGGHLDVDAVGVWAVSGCHDIYTLRFYILASIERYVKHLTIHWCQTTNHNVFWATEFQRLKTKKKTLSTPLFFYKIKSSNNYYLLYKAKSNLVMLVKLTSFTPIISIERDYNFLMTLQAIALSYTSISFYSTYLYATFLFYLFWFLCLINSDWFV